MKRHRWLSYLLNPRANLSKLHSSRPEEELPRRRVTLRHLLGNVPLVFGGLVVLGLLLVVMFGPLLAPENPYLRGRRVFEYVDGTINRPPYPPSAEHPLGTDELGRDTLSFLLYGTRNTLVAAAFITMARLLLGVILGGLAGWNEGKLADQLVSGVTQVLAALPMLLVAAIIILALDVRRGLPVFVVALCAIGWGEISQYVRAEFIRIKREPYLDSGRVIGLSGLELAVRHVLPNILPALIVITLLETGSVLMILGELGFVGIYISGGVTIQTEELMVLTEQRYMAVPEWGAMIAQSRMWARSRPWMPIFPAIAFFVSVTGFNLLGEGLRRLIDRGVFNTGALLTWRVLLIIALISAASVYVTVTLGPAPSYRQLAGQLSEADLLRHLEYLSSPEMKGRGVGSPEALEAAHYVQDQLYSYGLETFVRETRVTLARPVESPTLALLDEQGRTQSTFTWMVDYGQSVEGHGGSGLAEAPVTLVLFPPNTRSLDYERLRGLDLEVRIAMVLATNVPFEFDEEALIRGAEGILIVTLDITPRSQARTPGDLHHPSLPIFRIDYDTANAILAVDGLDLETAQEGIEASEWRARGWVGLDLSARVRMELELGPAEQHTLYSVFGLLVGSDSLMADEIVVVSCHHDGLGVGPDGTLYPGANENASGVAVMLEIARLWQEQGFQPRRSVLFAAWGGGWLPYSGAHDFVGRPGVLSSYDTSAVVHLDRMGGVGGGGLAVRPLGSNSNILELLMSSAGDMDVAIHGGASVRYSYQRVFRGESEPRYGGLILTWGDPPPGLAEDTADRINPEQLLQAAQAANLTLIAAAHEPRY
jgi:peptide/nickel transport system permease protein